MRIDWVINFLKRVGILSKDLKIGPNAIPGVSDTDKTSFHSRSINPQALDEILSSSQGIDSQIKIQKRWKMSLETYYLP